MRSARIQNCRVLGPRTTVSRVTRPRSAIRRSVRRLHPGKNGCSALRTNHGPIAFWLACFDSGSVNPPHVPHSAAVPITAPQYGHTSDGPRFRVPGSGGGTSCVGISGRGGGVSCIMLFQPLVHAPRLARRQPRFPPGHASRPRPISPTLGLSLAAAAILLASCTPKRDPGFDPVARLAPAPVSTPRAPDEPVALIDGEPLSLDDLRPALLELAGPLALEEAALTRLLRREIAARGILITPDLIDAEQRAFARAIFPADTPSADDRAALLLDQVRARRGLGPVRFAALLERSAMLRALVRADAPPDLEPSDDDLRTAHAIKHGPRVLARLIMVPTAVDAARAQERLLTQPFEAVAAAESIDPTASQGGLFGPISVDDPAYPVAIRRRLAELSPGVVSEPVAVTWPDASGATRSGYVLLRFEQTIAPDAAAPTLENSTAALRDEIRAVRERAAMDRLARTLLDAGPIRVLDRALSPAVLRER